MKIYYWLIFPSALCIVLGAVDLFKYGPTLALVIVLIAGILGMVMGTYPLWKKFFGKSRKVAK